MRDQYDAQMWIAHHDQFSGSIGQALAKGRDALLARLPSAAAATQLIAVTAAFGLTLLTFSASSV